MSAKKLGGEILRFLVEEMFRVHYDIIHYHDYVNRIFAYIS